jgi:hypothetical protein
VISGWIKHWQEHWRKNLVKNVDRLFKKSEHKSKLSDNRSQHELHQARCLSKLLKLYPYNAQWQIQQKLKPVSEKIEPAM